MSIILGIFIYDNDYMFWYVLAIIVLGFSNLYAILTLLKHII